jgi:GH43 family beta-xylosidase
MDYFYCEAKHFLVHGFLHFGGGLPAKTPARGRGEVAGGRTFTNPVVRQGADPWVIRRGTNYFFCQSHADGVWVNRASPTGGHRGGPLAARLACARAGTVWSKQIWAPELHFLQGKWYVYVAADDGDNASHRMYVLEGDSDRSRRHPSTSRARLPPPLTDGPSTAPSWKCLPAVFIFIWAGWPGTNDGVQNLYIAPMSNPWTISGERVCLSHPDQFWENRDYPHINEGPETLWHDGKLFVIYSASGFWDDNYCLGQLTWTGGDVLDPKSWVKHAGPVFAHTADVFGPGHCSFVKSPDGKEDWIIYHAHTGPGTSRRDVRIQPFSWNPDGSPHFGAPISPSIPLHMPSGE